MLFQLSWSACNEDLDLRIFGSKGGWSGRFTRFLFFFSEGLDRELGIIFRNSQKHNPTLSQVDIENITTQKEKGFCRSFYCAMGLGRPKPKNVISFKSVSNYTYVARLLQSELACSYGIWRKIRHCKKHASFLEAQGRGISVSFVLIARPNFLPIFIVLETCSVF